MDQINTMIAIVASFLCGALIVSLLWNIKSPSKNKNKPRTEGVKPPKPPPKRRTLSNSRSSWTKEEDEYLMDNITTKRKILAKDIGRTETAVSQRISKIKSR